MKPLRIFIGYDEVETVAYHVLSHSIIRQSSIPVSITPIALHHFRRFYSRDLDPLQSNEFAFSRFLVPYLCDMSGFAIWMDADMLVRCDIADLWDMRDHSAAVQCVKSIDFRPEETTKFLDRPQTGYPELADGTTRKLWSAMMLLNCDRCWNLTPRYVASAPGLDLHQFQWCREDQVRELPPEWQVVPGLHEYDPDAKVVHWTLGGPWFGRNYSSVDYAEEWHEEYEQMTHSEIEGG